MVKKKSGKSTKAKNVSGSIAPVVNGKRAPKWYMLSTLAVTIILSFVYFVDYLSANLFISVTIGAILIIWFMINFIMLIRFIKKGYDVRARSIAIIFFVYFGMLFINGFIAGFTNGQVKLISDPLSDLIELLSLILLIIFSLSVVHNRDYYN